MALTKVTYSMINGSPVNVTDYGFSTTATGAQNTAAIQAAIDACPSDGMVVFPPGNYTVAPSSSNPITIYKRIIVDGCGVLLTSTASSSGNIFKFAKTANTPASDLNFNGQLEGIQFKNFWISGATVPNGAVDNRTSTADVLNYDNAIDGCLTENVTIEGFKGAGIFFSGNGSIRESTWNNITIRYCGLNTGSDLTDRAQIHIINVQTGGDAHNELYFNRGRLIYSLWRDIRITRNQTNPASNGVRLVRFCDYQLENETPLTYYWNNPPACQKVWIEESAGYVSFENTEFFNQYATDVTKWGYSAVRIGNKPENIGADRVNFVNCVFQGNTLGGVAVELQKCSVFTITSTRVAMSDYDQARAIVVAEVNPWDDYGVSYAPASYAYVHIDPSCDFGLSPYYHDNTYSRALGSLKLPESPDPFQEVSFYPGGFASARTSFSAATGGVTYTTIDLRDAQFIPSGASADGLRYSVWLISANGSYTGGSNGVAVGTCLVTVMDGNTIADVTNFGVGYLNSTLEITFRRYNNDAAGTLSSGNGYKFDVAVTNTAGGPVAIALSATRFGVN